MCCVGDDPASGYPPLSFGVQGVDWARHLRRCNGEPMKVGILGGTGPAGRGLGLRLAVAGHDVVLGSRNRNRAELTALELLEKAPATELSLVGDENAQAAAAELVIVGTPWDSAVTTTTSLREELSGKVVISMAVALVKQGREMMPITMPRGSMSGMLQASLPQSQIVGAFHHLPAAELENLHSGLESDVLVCSDHDDATHTALDLVSSMEGFRPINAGSLAQAGAIEAFTAVCITVNIRYRVHSAVRLAGI